jgi:REP element-mobilizing transposase RayT
LTAAPFAQWLVDSARYYESKQRLHVTLFLLMPDHLHALLSFASDESMSKIVGDWKHFKVVSTASFGRKDISTIACAPLNAANSYQRR